MKDGGVLAARRTAIVAAWLADTLNSYPAETRQILTTVSDRFRNPAGFTLREALPALFDAIVSGDWAQAPGPLGDLVQLRAVQGFSREEAVAFVARLKDVVSEFAGPELQLGAIRGLADLDARIDRRMAMALDVYDNCRARIDAIRRREITRRSWMLERLDGRARAHRMGIPPDRGGTVA